MIITAKNVYFRLTIRKSNFGFLSKTQTIKQTIMEQPSKHNKSIFEIPLEEAKTLTKAWAEQGHFIKSYLIDAQELKDMLAEPNVSYIRVYFGWDNEMEIGRQQRLIMVPANLYGNDLINTNSLESEAAKDVDSNIFDFTLPCPPTCPPDSPLVD